MQNAQEQFIERESLEPTLQMQIQNSEFIPALRNEDLLQLSVEVELKFVGSEVTSTSTGAGVGAGGGSAGAKCQDVVVLNYSQLKC